MSDEHDNDSRELLGRKKVTLEDTVIEAVRRGGHYLSLPLSWLYELSDKDYKALFKAGRKFEVVEPGCHIWGMTPTAPYTQTGFRLDLQPGDVITCRGSSMTSGDGVPAIKWADKDCQWICNDPTFSPALDNSMWSGVYPMRGYLTPLYEPDEEFPKPTERRVVPALQKQLDRLNPKPQQAVNVWVIRESGETPVYVSVHMEDDGGVPATLRDVVNFDKDVVYPEKYGCVDCGAPCEKGQDCCTKCIEASRDENAPDRAHIKRLWEAAHQQLGHLEGEAYKELDASLRRISALLEQGKAVML